MLLCFHLNRQSHRAPPPKNPGGSTNIEPHPTPIEKANRLDPTAPRCTRTSSMTASTQPPHYTGITFLIPLHSHALPASACAYTFSTKYRADWVIVLKRWTLRIDVSRTSTQRAWGWRLELSIGLVDPPFGGGPPHPPTNSHVEALISFGYGQKDFFKILFFFFFFLI